MKLIILAAGQGTRLRPLTNEVPKCMVNYNDKPIIDYILEVTKQCNIQEIAVINGYKKEVLEKYLENENLTFYTNTKYESTNMVSTLFTAKEFMNDDVIVSYADIIYDSEVLKTLIKSQDPFSVIVDKQWKQLWLQRMPNPLEDAETLKIKNSKIIEIGKKAISYDEIEAQYIGLFKISKSVINEVLNYYETLDKNADYDGKNFDNMYMTTFIQKIIDNLLDVKPVIINGGWVEVDSITDLETKAI